MVVSRWLTVVRQEVFGNNLPSTWNIPGLVELLQGTS